MLWEEKAFESPKSDGLDQSSAFALYDRYFIFCLQSKDFSSKKRSGPNPTTLIQIALTVFTNRIWYTSLFFQLHGSIIEPQPVKNVPSDNCTQRKLGLRIHIVWSECLLSAWRNVAPLPIQNAPSEDSDQTALGAHVRKYVFRRCGSINSHVCHNHRLTLSHHIFLTDV